ncbi:N-acetylneuraminic acid mutarotase [Bacteroidales bacterium Barb6]|nr:N-acetylneuraminic acid mutarotase [Bacteroidales bacterium Barb6]
MQTMKHIYLFLSVLAACLLAVGCAEDPVIGDGVIGAEVPVVVTDPIDVGTVTATSITISGKIVQENGAPVTARGFQWKKTDEDAYPQDNTIEAGEGKGDFSITITALKNATGYHIRAYGINREGTGYGEVKSFQTILGLGSVETIDVQQIKSESAVAVGKILLSGEGEILRRGFYYSEASFHLTATKDSVISTMETDSFSCVLKDLKPETHYYVQSFVTNRFGTFTGEQKVFDTKASFERVETLEPQPIDIQSALAVGRVVASGEGVIIRRGFYYAEAPFTLATAAKDSVVSTMETDSFTCKLTGLKPGTTYYVRAFITNRFNTLVGEQEEFTTSDGKATLGELTATPRYTEIYVTSTVAMDGGYAVTERGFCYSESNEYPTVADTKIVGSGTDHFNGLLTGLESGTKYHIRAYAVNRYGTAYSEVRTASLLNILPTVRPLSHGFPRAGVMSVGGQVTDKGMSDITAAGICWALHPNPVVETDNVVILAQGLGTFRTELTEIQGSATYYVRVFARNDVGIAYSETDTISSPTVFETKSTAFGGSLRQTHSASYFTLNDGRGYLLGGDAGASRISEFYLFDPVFSWRKLSSYDAERSLILTAVAGNTLYAFGGIGNDKKASSDFYYYSSSTNQWTTIRGDRGRPMGMYGSAGCAINNTIYFIGGVRDDNLLNDVWAYNTVSLTWERKGPMPSAFEKQYGGFAAVINDVIYTGLGQVTLGGDKPGSSQLWQTADGGTSWLQTTSTGSSGTYMAGTVYRNKIYIVDSLGVIWVFDTESKTWAHKSILPDSYKGNVHCMYAIGDTIYIGLSGNSQTMMAYYPLWDSFKDDNYYK